MKSSLFIKTYIRDYDWLEWCLKSIDKFATFDEYVLAIGISDKDKVPDRFKREPYRWVHVEDDLDIGYLNQQVIKHHADLYCKGDYIVFFDSDCVFTDHVTIETYLSGDRPIIPYTPHAVLGDATPWKPITEKCLRFICHSEYMRRHPLVYHRDDLHKFREWFKELTGQEIAQYIKVQPNREYSEFCTLGAYFHKMMPDNYCFMNTEDPEEIPCSVRQFWSYDRVTEKSIKELEEICN